MSKARKDNMPRTPITMKEYQEIMDKIIAEGLEVHETLIKMLNTAAKYDIVKEDTFK